MPEPGFYGLLPNLRSLYANWIGRQGRRLSIAELTGHDLRELAVEWLTIEPGDVERLGLFSGLRRLALDAGPRDSVKPVAGLRNLEYLFLRGGRNGWAHLGALDGLEEVAIFDARLPDLRVMRRWERVRSLYLRGRRIKSLGGIRALEALQWATLDYLGVTDLAPLDGLERLTRLELSALRLDDLSPLARLSSLRDLTLSGGESPWHVASLAPLAELTHLQELKLRGARIRDRDLSSLERLPSLRRVDLYPAGYLGDAVTSFRRARPGVTVAVPDADGNATPGIAVGPVEIHPPEPEMDLPDWWIFQDLTDLLGVGANADAEARLRRAIGRRSRDLLKRLSFDTEAGGVGVEAKSEADIREVAQLIRELAAARERRS